MARGYCRKCKCCLKFFRPDPCNRRHQRFCAAPHCKRASKAASQARWLGKPANQGYFRDAWHVARVRAWRRANLGVPTHQDRIGSRLTPTPMCSATPTTPQPGSPAHKKTVQQRGEKHGLIWTA